MTRRRFLTCSLALGAVLLLVLLCIGGSITWRFVRPQPAPKTETLFRGIEYTRAVRTSPRPLVIHVVEIDLQADGLRVFVTPGDPDQDLPLAARTTSEFLEDFDLQLAVNGDAFEPWEYTSPWNYYPQPGDRVDVIGFASSEGTAYSQAHKETPTLYISQNNNARFDRPFSNLHHAISGTTMLLENGRVVAPGGDDPEPRTAVGLNRGGKRMILVVVDGRQPGYSEGVTQRELAGLLREFGAHDAMNLDGGGSSTLVRENALGGADVMNSPIDGSIPGRERVVGNHLGFYAREE